jgi:hypothetical protein
MIKIFKNKLSLPVIGGLALAFVDLVFWIWFIVYVFLNPSPDILGDGLFVVMMIHFPSSIVLPLLWITIGQFLDGVLSIFFPAGQLLSQFLIVFTAGIIQYFLIGYLLGWIVLFSKKKLSKQEYHKEPEDGKEIAVAGKINKSKIVLINLAYFVFSISIFQLVQGYLREMFFNFALFKIAHPTSNILMYTAVFSLWIVFSFYVYRFGKKALRQDKWNLVYMLMPLLVILITWIFIN